jgi:beta-glucosidase/6-phospho-beta-glucosidase/beta-galactosidase
MKRLTITIAMLAAALAAPAADASTRQLTVMQDDSQVRGRTTATLNEFDRLGVDIVKVNLYWDEVAPNRRRKPSGFDGANPSDYDWSNYGAVIDGIIERGMRPFLSLGGRGPRWATGSKGRKGTYRPNAKEFGLFAEAAGRQFPQVDIWSIWNEPNLYS